MNATTRDKLVRFINVTERLAVGCAHLLGTDFVTEFCVEAEKLVTALEKDETII